MPLNLELSDSLWTDDGQDKNRPAVCTECELRAFVVQRITVDILPLLCHHLDLGLLNVPQTYLLVVAIEQFP